MNSQPTISIIIPTYNRIESLLRTLRSIESQTYPMEQVEAIVVDDGSTDLTPTIVDHPFSFRLQYLQQKNQGATAARNHGARNSQAEILVFIDDDITISPQTLEAFASKYLQASRIVLMGTILKRSGPQKSVYTTVVLTMADHALVARDQAEFHFVDCNSELLACRRVDFFEIGMFQDPTEGHGWPNWDDVDFGYRAHLNGFRLIGASAAMAEHWDYSISERSTACHRFYRAGRSAVWLCKRYPKLKTEIPMLYDKTPPAWGQDSAPLIARKLARRLISTSPMLGLMSGLASLIERYYPLPTILRRLYYLLHGANLFQGYHAGLRELARAEIQK